MKASEAIEILIGIRCVSGYSKSREKALDMAIAALEKQEGEGGLTMAKYIEREAFIEAKRKQYCADCDRRKGMKNGKMRFCYEIGEAPCRACYVDDLLTDVEDFPAADVVEVRHGRWEERIVDDPLDPYGFFKRRWYCSSCGRYQTYGTTAFCPKCGAKIDGGVNDAAD